LLFVGTKEVKKVHCLVASKQALEESLLLDIEEAVFLATDLILLAPNPGQIVERLSLDFGQRYAAGESARAIKSDPRFIETREPVLGKVFSQRQVYA